MRYKIKLNIAGNFECVIKNIIIISKLFHAWRLDSEKKEDATFSMAHVFCFSILVSESRQTYNSFTVV